MPEKYFWCPENYSPSADFQRRLVWEKIKSYFWDSFKLDGLYLRPDFLEEHQELINQRIQELPWEVGNRLDYSWVKNLEIREKVESWVVSIIGHKWEFSWSWGFIRPNVIATAAHVLRDPENGEMSLLGLILWWDGNTYTPKAIYIDTICWDDIAFILTDESAESSFEILKQDYSSTSDTLTLWMPWTQPSFFLESQMSLPEKIFPMIQKFIEGLLRVDVDKDSTVDSKEYKTTYVHIVWGHSWGLVINPDTWGLKWIIARWSKYENVNIWGQYEPVSKLRPRFIDFVNAMTEFWLEVK